MGESKRAARRQKTKVEHIDRKVARTTGAARHSVLVKAMGQASELADQPPLIALSGATLALGLVTRNGRLARTGARMLASHWLATQAKSFVKHRIDRLRPFAMLRGEAYHARAGHSSAKAESSFPSGHMAGAVAVARAAARDYPAGRPIGYTAATAAGAIQLPRGAHYLSDILVGAAIGWMSELLVSAILPATSKKPPEATGLEDCVGDGGRTGTAAGDDAWAGTSPPTMRPAFEGDRSWPI